MHAAATRHIYPRLSSTKTNAKMYIYINIYFTNRGKGGEEVRVKGGGGGRWGDGVSLMWLYIKV